MTRQDLGLAIGEVQRGASAVRTAAEGVAASAAAGVDYGAETAALQGAAADLNAASSTLQALIPAPAGGGQ